MIVTICDDDPQMRQAYGELTARLAQRRGKHVNISYYEDGSDLLAALEASQAMPDILVLDAIMPVCSGVKAARKLRARGYAGVIIFLTVSSDFALAAFDVGAYNYILKSEKDAYERYTRVLEEAMRDIERRERKYMLLNGIREHRSVDISEIRYFTISRHICTVYYGKGESFEFVTTLSKLENYLFSYGFVRIHRGYLVNTAHMVRHTFKSVRMDDGTELPVGRGRYAALRAFVEQRGREHEHPGEEHSGGEAAQEGLGQEASEERPEP